MTFFVKSIIQDSAKKGYEKVLFPTGNTASKVEGHTTLEEFKKEKEDRIKQLKQELESNKQKQSVTSFNDITQKEFSIKNEKGERVDYIKREGVWVKQKLTNEGEFKQAKPTNEDVLNAYKESLQFLKLNENIDNEINQLKQELERVEKEGFGALRPIYNFYENTVTNILKKQGYQPKLITDEYGNTWNEVSINKTHLNTIFLQILPDEPKHRARIIELTKQTKNPEKALIALLRELQIINKKKFKGNYYIRSVDKDATDGRRAYYQNRVNRAETIAARLEKAYSTPIISLIRTENAIKVIFNKGTLGFSAFEKDMLDFASTEENKKIQIDSEAADAVLDAKMKDIMSLMGIKMADYEDYKQWYEKKYGRPLGAIGVADMLHQVIAVKEGHTDISTLPEEVGHFIIWAMKDDPIMKEMIANAHLSEQWELHSKEYLADYNGNEQMVRMEIIGKMLADQIVADHKAGIVKPYWRQKLENLWKRFLRLFGVKESEQQLLKSRISEIAGNVARRDVAQYANRLQKGERLEDVQIFKKLDPKRAINSKLLTGRISHIDKGIEIIENRIRYYKSRGLESFIEQEEKKLTQLKTQKKSKRHTFAISFIIKNAYDKAVAIQERIDALEKAKEDGSIKNNLIQNARILDEMRDHTVAYKDLIKSIERDLASIDIESLEDADRGILEDAIHDVTTTRRVIDRMEDVYKEHSLYLVAEWLKPVFNNIRFNTEADRQAAIKQMEASLEKGLDIHTIDANVRSLASSRSDILSFIDARIKDYIEIARQKTEQDKHDIFEIHENAGMQDTSFMYEKDSHGIPTRYILTEVHYGKFETERSSFIAGLRRKYTTPGDNRPWNDIYQELDEPDQIGYTSAVSKWYKDNTEVKPDVEQIKESMRERIYSQMVTETAESDIKKAQEKNAKREYDSWLESNKTYDYVNGEKKHVGYKGILSRPLLSKYANPAFNNLTAQQKQYYDQMMKKRDEMFVGLNAHFRYTNLAPQIRKDWLERLKTGGQYKENLKELMKELYMPVEDDTEYVRLDEGNKRVKSAPLWFFREIENPMNLSMDFTGGMVMLADTVNRHKTFTTTTSMIRMVQDVVDNRTILSGRKDDLRDEIVGIGGNTAKRLRDYIEMNVYGEMKENETYARALDSFMTYTALNTLAFNLYASINNSILGNLMIKQEQLSGKYIKKENLSFADSTMNKKNLSEVMNDIGKVTTTSKLRLFLDKVDALQDHRSRMHTNADRGRRSRLFNMSTVFFMTTFGEWQIGARMALAMADTIKLKDAAGTPINLYDAFDVKGKRLVMKDGITKEDGTPLTEADIRAFTIRLAQVNQSMHGIYNETDRSALQKHAIGRLIFQFRKYFVPQFDRRWADKHINAALGEEEEGYYRTAARVWKKLNDETNVMKFLMMMKSPFNNEQLKQKGLTDLEISNTIKTATEIYFILGCMVIGGALSMLAGELDDDEPILSWGINMSAYQMNRLSTEMGAYILPSELLKLLSSPAASINQFSHFTSFLNSFDYNPFDDDPFIRVYSRGRHKDDTRLYVWTKKAVPLVDTIEDWFYPEEKAGYFNMVNK